MASMELRHLRYFIAVAKNLNFSEASRRLHVAQAAVSQTVLDFEEQLKAFEEKRIDIGLSRAPPKDRAEEFGVELIYEDQLRIMLPAGHALAKKRVVDLKDVADEIFVQGYRGGAPSLYAEVIATCRRAGFLPKVAFELEMMNTVIFAVESGLGISLLPGCVSHLH